MPRLSRGLPLTVRSRRAEDREAQPGLGNVQPASGIGTNDVTLKVDFEEKFVGR
jgi:hypothetical protein